MTDREMRSGRLLLVPNTLDLGCPDPVTGNAPDLQQVLPLGVIREAARIAHWIAENAKTTRAFLKRVDQVIPLSQALQGLSIEELPRPVKGGKADKGAKDAKGAVSGEATILTTLLALQVGLDGLVIQRPELNGDAAEGLQQLTGSRARHAHSGVKANDLSAHCSQLNARRRVVARFAERLPAQVRDLVRSDHDHVLVEPPGHLLRFGLSQSAGQGQWRLAGQGCFIHIRGAGLERLAQASQQFASVGRARAQHQPRQGSH